MNFKRTLTKSSLKSSPSSEKSNVKLNELKELQDEIESLKRNISSLKVLLDSRDVAVGNLAREKEKLYIEHKKLQRTNRNLQQELVDERESHTKEKVFLLENMKRLSLKLANCESPNAILAEEENVLALQNEIKSKNEVIYNVCCKYFKLKKSKDELYKNYRALQKHMHEAFETIVTSLEDNKNTLDSLLDELRKSAKINPSHKKYVKLLNDNANLHFENTQLKLYLIAKNKFDPSAIEQVEVQGIAEPRCSRSDNQFDSHKHEQQQTQNSVEKAQCHKFSTSKLAEAYHNFNYISAFSKCNRKVNYKLYRSKSDSLLPRNFYK